MEHLSKIMHRKWNMSSDMEQQNQEHQHHEQQLEWRRDKVQELCSKGYSQREISHMYRGCD